MRRKPSGGKCRRYQIHVLEADLPNQVSDREEEGLVPAGVRGPLNDSGAGPPGCA